MSKKIARFKIRARVRLPVFLLSVVFATLLLPAVAFAVENDLEKSSLELLQYRVGETGVTITGCDPSATRIYIPDYIEGKPVVSIMGFGACPDLKEVRLPSTLRLIGFAAFRGCESLEKIILPEGLTTLGEQVFAGCTALKEVYIPASLTSFNINIFQNCQDIQFTIAENHPSLLLEDGVLFNQEQTILLRAGLIEAELYSVPETVFEIGAEAFAQSSVQIVRLGENVRSIGDDAFNGAQLKEILLNEGLESIGEKAFMGTTNLKNLALPNSLTTLGETVFKDSGLEKIDFSNTQVETLPRWTFWGTKNLRDINLGDNITIIDPGAFRDCTFQEITLPANLRILGDAAFGNCTNLETITLPHTLKAMGSNVFANCLALQAVYFEGNMPMRGSRWNEDIEGVHPRHDDSFAQLPLAVAEQLKIYVLEGAQGWGEGFKDYADGYVAGRTSRVEFEYPVEYYTLSYAGTQESRIILHPPLALDMLEIDAVTEPIEVLGVGLPTEEVVWKSSQPSVATVDKEGRVRAVAEGRSRITAQITYQGKTYLGQTEVNVIDDTSIFDWSVQSDGTVRINGFKEGISEVEMAHLSIPENIGGYQVSRIKANAFRNNQYIFSVTIPGSVDIIGNNAFADTPFLRELTIEEGVEELHAGAFSGSKIREVVVPESVTQLQDNVFADCDQLETAVIKANISGPYSMGRALFQNNTSLKHVTFAEGIESIGAYTFDGATSLETITLPSTLQGLEQNVFRNNTSLRTVEFQGPLTRQRDYTNRERFNPFSGTDNVLILHPDDGNNWDNFLGEAVTTQIQGETRGDSSPEPQPVPAEGSLPRAEARPETELLEASEDLGEEQSQNEPEAVQGDKLNVYEIVKDTLIANPWQILLVALVSLGLIILGGTDRYRNFTKNK